MFHLHDDFSLFFTSKLLVHVLTGGDLDPDGAKIEALQAALGPGVPVDVLGGSIIDWAVRSDEVAFRSWAEPHLLSMARDSPKALVYLDCGSLVEPGWLGPLVAAVSADPFVMAVPDIVHFGSLEGGHQATSGGNLAASAGGQFDLALNYYVPKPASAPLGSEAMGAGATASLKGDSSSSSEQAASRRVQRVGATSLVAFAVHSDWWAALGGFEVAVSAGLGLGFWPSDLPPLEASSAAAAASGQVILPGAGAPALELSLRHWGCGGAIQVVPCSVVQRQSGRGAGNRQPTASETQAASTAALKVAELWLAALAPSVWASHGEPRRSPFAMTRKGIDAAARESLEVVRNRLGSQSQCKGLEWFLEHVDPELFLADRSHLPSSGNNHNNINGNAAASASAALPAFPTGAACKDHPDYVESCAGWAELGECVKNPAFMVPYCPRACGGCGGGNGAAAALPAGKTREPAGDAGFYPHKEAVAFAHAPAESSSSSSVGGGNVKAVAAAAVGIGEGARAHGDDPTYQDLPHRHQADDHTAAHQAVGADAAAGGGGVAIAAAAAPSWRDPDYWLHKDHGPAPTDPAIAGSTWPPPDPRWLSRRRLDANEPAFPPKQPPATCGAKDGHATLLTQVEVDRKSVV